ncbi:hypothetical protein RI367_007057 [Sorochytrium milnesiophthora]
MFAALPPQSLAQSASLLLPPSSASLFAAPQDLRAPLTLWLKRAVACLVRGSEYVRELVVESGRVVPEALLSSLLLRGSESGGGEYGSSDEPSQGDDDDDNDGGKATNIDSLEAYIVNAAIVLTQALASYDDIDRCSAVLLLWELALLWDTSLARSTSESAESVVLRFHSSVEDHLQSTRFLFRIIAPSLCIMAPALVTALECYYKTDCGTTAVRRCVAITVLTQLVVGCTDQHVHRVASAHVQDEASAAAAAAAQAEEHRGMSSDDHLAVVWNVFFAVSTQTSEHILSGSCTPERLCMVESLGELSPLYCAEDHALALRVIDSLLRLPNKARRTWMMQTRKESAAIKSTLRAVYERLSKRDDVYRVFLGLVNPNDEHAYDLLDWAIQTFAHTSRPVSAASALSKPLSSGSSAALLRYVESLANHFRAPSALVRHGAAISLHASLRMYSRLTDDVPQLYGFVLAGVLDTDHLVSAVYLTVLAALPQSVDNGVRDMVARFRQRTTAEHSYDVLYGRRGGLADDDSSAETTLDRILNTAAKRCPTPVPWLLQRVASTLDHLQLQDKLRQIAVIKHWCANLAHYDNVTVLCLLKLLERPVTHLPDQHTGAVSSVVGARPADGMHSKGTAGRPRSALGITAGSCLGNVDEDIQAAALDALCAIAPTLKKAPVVECVLVWSHMRASLQRKDTSESLLLSLLQLLSMYPIVKTGAGPAAEMLQTLLQLIFCRWTQVRKRVYTLIADRMPQWSDGSIGLGGTALAILLLALGDADREWYFTQAVVGKYKPLVPYLQTLQTALAGRDIFATFDDLANMLVRDREDYDAILRFASQEAVADAFWHAHLASVPDSMQVKPDEYNYMCIFVQQPYWTALLFSKLALRPPPCPVTEKRTSLPTIAALKRRFHLGYALMLFPSAVITDPIIRKQACMCLIRCCFRQVILSPTALKALHDYVQFLFLSQKAWTYQASAYDLVKMMLKLKLPGVSQSLFSRYIGLALETAASHPVNTVRMAAMEMLETCVFSFPAGIAGRLAEIRDCIRPLITDKDPSLYMLALRIWPLLFRSVSDATSGAFLDYLRDEIDTIKRGSTQVQADPLLKHLTQDELTRVVVADINAMGVFRSVSLAPAIVRDLLVIVRNTNRYVREAAVSAVLGQSRLLTDVHKNAVMWILLPLFCDPCDNVRRCYMEKTMGTPDPLETACKAYSPHPDDAFVLDIFELDQVLSETAMLSVAQRNLADCLPHNALPISSDIDTIMSEVSSFRPTLIAKELLLRFKDMAARFKGEIPEQFTNEVLYYLQSYDTVHLITPVSYLVISEFVCLHEKLSAEVLDLLVSGIDVDLTQDKRPLFEAALLSIRNISEFSSTAFQAVLQKLMASDTVTDGSIIALSHMSDLVLSAAANKVVPLLDRYMPLVASNKQSVLRRVWAANLCIDLATAADSGGDSAGDSDSVNRTADALQQLLEVVPDEWRSHVLSLLSKVMAQIGPEHPLFVFVIRWAKQGLMDSASESRARCLKLFRIFARHIGVSELVPFLLLFLADPTVEACTLRWKAVEVLLSNGLAPDLLGDQTRLRKTAADWRAAMHAIVDFVQRPAIAELGLRQDKILGFEIDYSVPLPDRDAYNQEFYTSDRRKKFSDHYGLPEAMFLQQTQPVFKSLLAKMEEVFHEAGVVLTPPQQQQFKEVLSSVDTLVILREAIRHHPAETAALLETLLGDIESWLGSEAHASATKDKDGERTQDLDRLLHLFDLLGNLLIAGDGAIKETKPFIARLNALIDKCSQSISATRESLYDGLEKSLFFFNEYMDIPITSEDQYTAWEKMKDELQEASMDVMRTGQADRLSRFDERRNASNRTVEDKTEVLRRLTTVQHQSLGVLALVCVASRTLADNEIIACADFFRRYLSDEHRGVRAIVVEAVSALCKSHMAQWPKVGEYTTKCTTMLLATVRDHGVSLYRRKVDHVRLMTLLTVPGLKRDVEASILRLLVDLWRDPDSTVRSTAIDMVKELGCAGSAVVLSAFQDDAVADAPGHIRLLKEISVLISTPEYAEKDQLNGLLGWYFNRDATGMGVVVPVAPVTESKAVQEAAPAKVSSRKRGGVPHSSSSSASTVQQDAASEQAAGMGCTDTLHDLTALKNSPEEQEKRHIAFRSRHASKPAEAIDLRQLAAAVSKRHDGNDSDSDSDDDGAPEWPAAPPPLPIGHIDAARFQSLMHTAPQRGSTTRQVTVPQEVDVERELRVFEKTWSPSLRHAPTTTAKAQQPKTPRPELKRPSTLRQAARQLELPMTEMRRLRRAIQHMQSALTGLQDVQLSDDDDDDHTEEGREGEGDFRKTMAALTTMTVGLARKITEMDGRLRAETAARLQAERASMRAQHRVQDLTDMLDTLQQQQQSTARELQQYRQTVDTQLRQLTRQQSELATAHETQAISSLFSAVQLSVEDTDDDAGGWLSSHLTREGVGGQ